MLTAILRRNVAALPLFGFAALLFCSPQAGWSQSSPCNMLTEKQLSSALGVNVGAGSPIGDYGCSWHAANPAKVMVTVSMQSAKMFEGAKKSPVATNKPVSGIGDEAIFTGVPNFCSLWVRKGAKYLLVRVYGLQVSDAEPKLKSIAADAVSKI